MGLMLCGPQAHGLLSLRTVHYNPTNSKHLVFSAAAIPEQLQGQMSVLRYFASYMEQHLVKVSVGNQGWAGIVIGLEVGLWLGHTAWGCGNSSSQAVVRWTNRVVLGVGTLLLGVSRFVCMLLVLALMAHIDISL